MKSGQNDHQLVLHPGLELEVELEQELEVVLEQEPKKGAKLTKLS